MDLFGIVSTLYAIIKTTFAVAFSLPFGIGWVLQTCFYIACIWVLYHYTPTSLARFVKQKIAPHLSFVTRNLRKLLIRILADPEWLSQTGDAKARIEYREVYVSTRSMKSNIFLRTRWAAFGALGLLAIQNRETVLPWLKPILPW